MDARRLLSLILNSLRCIEYKYELCASDIVYSIGSLLEASASCEDDSLDHDIVPQTDQDKCWRDNFHLAYGALPW